MSCRWPPSGARPLSDTTGVPVLVHEVQAATGPGFNVYACPECAARHYPPLTDALDLTDDAPQGLPHDHLGLPRDSRWRAGRPRRRAPYLDGQLRRPDSVHLGVRSTLLLTQHGPGPIAAANTNPFPQDPSAMAAGITFRCGLRVTTR
jgi:hypothetical protein